MLMKQSDRTVYGPWKRRIISTGCFAFVNGGMKYRPCCWESAVLSGNRLLPYMMRIPDENVVLGFVSYNLSGYHEIWYPRSLKMKERRMVIDSFGLKGYIHQFRVYAWPFIGLD